MRCSVATIVLTSMKVSTVQAEAMDDTHDDAMATSDPFGAAFALSLVAHALVLSLPHPALWTAPIDMPAALGRPGALTVRLSLVPPRAAPPLPRADDHTIADGSAVPPRNDGMATSASATPDRIHVLDRALSRPPEIAGTIEEEISFAGKAAGGELLLRLIIDENGIARHVQALRSTLPRAVEGEIALKFFRARYRAGEIDGRPVAAEMLVSIKVGAGDTAVAPPRLTGPAGTP